MAPPEGELPQAEGEAWRRTWLAGLGASPSVAARQLPLGGRSWIGLLARCVRRLLWANSRLVNVGSWIGAIPSAVAAAGSGARARAVGAGGSATARSEIAPPRGSCRRLRGRPGGGPSWQGWEPPPQSLRDSSPSGGAVGSDCSRAACGASVGSDCSRVVGGAVTEWQRGGSPAPKLGGPPSAFGISPRKAGGEGIPACSEDS